MTIEVRHPEANPEPATGEVERQDPAQVAREGTRPGWVFRPDVDIVEREDAFVVAADLPGAAEADVHIELREGMLLLDAKPRHDSLESWRPVYREYESGGFHREFGISDEIDRDAIEARIRNGVLELVLPKARHHTPRRIEVQGL